MGDAFIVEAVRTPVGKRGGALSKVHPTDLGAAVLTELVERSGIEPEAVEDVVLGCVDQVGAQSFNLGRGAVLSAGLPESVPGTTIDRQCGSSLQSLHFAAQGVMSGTQDLVVAAGVEVMSMVPILSSTIVGEENGLGSPFGGEGFRERYPFIPSQFRGAELMAERWSLNREEMERFALRSHQRAAQAWDDGHFDNEVLPIAGLDHDEGVRPDASLEVMAALDPLPEFPRLTAAISSQISDAAAGVLVASEQAIERFDLRPRARVRAMSVVGEDPELMLTGPIPATAQVLERGGIQLEEIDLFEVNEAFAPVVLVWAQETGADLERTNVNGGAIALGHPLGATGAKLTTTLVNELERRDARLGLIAICEGGGTANATILERVSV